MKFPGEFEKQLNHIEATIDNFRKAFERFNGVTIKPVRTRENTMPTRFEDFADEWASAYQAM
jgi:hypothetical protein